MTGIQKAVRFGMLGGHVENSQAVFESGFKHYIIAYGTRALINISNTSILLLIMIFISESKVRVTDARKYKM